MRSISRRGDPTPYDNAGRISLCRNGDGETSARILAIPSSIFGGTQGAPA